MATVLDDVFENADLLKIIVRKMVTTPSCSGNEFREYAIDRLRTCFAISPVNRLFRSVAGGFKHRMMRSFDIEMVAFRDRAQQWVEGTLTGSFKEQWWQVEERSLWACAAYGLHVTSLFGLELPSLRPSRTVELDCFLESKVPNCPGELCDMLERRCVCCGACRPMVVTGPGAWSVHPYRGALVEVSNDNGGQPDVFQAGSWIPHTCAKHFFEVLFGYDGLKHKFGACLGSYEPPGAEERRFQHFLRAACREQWYEPSIARLFSLRPKRLRPTDDRHGDGPHQRRFVSSICMYEPHMHCKEDFSVQSIFALTRAQVDTMIRRGSAMAREERLLAA